MKPSRMRYSHPHGSAKCEVMNADVNTQRVEWYVCDVVWLALYSQPVRFFSFLISSRHQNSLVVTNMAFGVGGRIITISQVI
ncbi:hypothetical protein Y032_0003g1203 [Ancylostoma ceylanicum]|uniref:Uncharacterized protein n=1 Tax=Ancylostoma ceylanicum TaxID=53326 RepID=A0A016VXH6_9BILA|nr:hypothetical protein Y032_0003g1203 [Ancylostoma ceylanicum]